MYEDYLFELGHVPMDEQFPENRTISPRKSRPLGILPSVYLSDRQKKMLKKLHSFRAPYLEEKLLEKEIFSKKEYNHHFKEFKRYIALTQMTAAPLAVLTSEVDEVWHQFILFTREYHDFCDEVAGDYIHHVPSTRRTPLPPDATQNTITHYQKYFGNLDISKLTTDFFSADR